MNKNGKRYWYIIFLGIFIIICFIGIWCFSPLNKTKTNTTQTHITDTNTTATQTPIKTGSVNGQDFTYNKDGTVTLGLGMTAHGIYDASTNKIIDHDTFIETKNGTFKGRINFQQNIETKRKYLLIVLIDFQQYEFSINGTTYNSYPFTLDSKDEVIIDIEVDNLDNNVQVFNYIIVTEPDILNLSFDDWNTIYLTHEFYSWRLFFDNLTSDEQVLFDTFNDVMEDQISYGMQLTRNHDKVSTVPTSKSEEKINP